MRIALSCKTCIASACIKRTALSCKRNEIYVKKCIMRMHEKQSIERMKNQLFMDYNRPNIVKIKHRKSKKGTCIKPPLVVSCRQKGGGNMDKAGQASATLMPVTIRFTPDVWQALRDTAQQEGVPVAEIARLAIAGKLGDYFGTIKCLDRTQAREIRKQAAELSDAVTQIGLELNRIGVNYNQQVRALHEMNKNGAASRPVGPAISGAELQELMEQYRRVSERIGDIICLTRV